MSKISEAAGLLINSIQEVVKEVVREQQTLADKAERLTQQEDSLKSREAAVASVEQGDEAAKAQEARKAELLELQGDISRETEELHRQQKAFAQEKSAWEKQRESDQKGIDNEREEITKQNAALAKEKAEYKEKILKKLKVEVG